MRGGPDPRDEGSAPGPGTTNCAGATPGTAVAFDESIDKDPTRLDAGAGLAGLPGAGATITVTLNDARTYDATIVGVDSTTDLAVLFLANPPSDLTPIALGDSASLAVEQPDMPIRKPLGLSGSVTDSPPNGRRRWSRTSAPDPKVTLAARPG